MQEININQEQVGQRLDKVLTLLLPELNRSKIQQLIESEKIVVNDAAAKKHYFLRLGDRVTIKDVVIIPEKKVAKLKPRIIFENNEYLIIDKPAGLIVHPSNQYQGYTLVDYLVENFPQVKKIGPDPLRPGIVHRLDKDASGVMVIALTDDSYKNLVTQFKLRQVKKEYMALAWGKVTPETGQITLPLARSKQVFTKRVANNAEGKDAITNYVVEKYLPKASLLKVSPQTGRTHQIRVHFYALGHSLIGDKIYYSKKNKIDYSSRLMLHAFSLSFLDLAGQSQSYKAELPTDFSKTLKKFDN